MQVRRKTRRRSPSGLTIIEVLCVVVLMSAAVSTLMFSLNGAADAARKRSAIALLQQVDSMARFWGASQQAVLLVANTDERRLEVRDQDGAVLATRTLPRGMRVRFTRDPLAWNESIAFNLNGTSRPYGVHLFDEADSSGEDSWIVSGLTGAWDRAR